MEPTGFEPAFNDSQSLVLTINTTAPFTSPAQFSKKKPIPLTGWVLSLSGLHLMVHGTYEPTPVNETGFCFGRAMRGTNPVC